MGFYIILHFILWKVEKQSKFACINRCHRWFKSSFVDGYLALLMAGQIDFMIGAGANILSPVLNTKSDTFAF